MTKLVLPVKEGFLWKAGRLPRLTPAVKELLGAKMHASGPARPLKSRRSSPLRGVAAIPGDKSISHRALILGALSVGETSITGLLEAEDVLNTAAAMRAFGAGVTRDGEGAWRVSGTGVGGWAEPENVLDFGNSGTGSRLVMGAMALPPSLCPPSFQEKAKP